MTAELTDWCEAISEDEWLTYIAQDSFLAFAQRVNHAYQVAPHIEVITAALEDVEAGICDRLIITMPPRHSKSMTVSETFPDWFIARDPDRRVIGAAHTDFLAYTFSRRARNKFEHPNWPFPNVRIAKDLGNVKSWDIEGHRGGYVAVGVGAGVAGHGADLFILDDPIKNPQDAMSETMRQKTWEWFTEVAVERLEPGGRIVAVSTRWHEDDVIGRILASPEAPRWRVIHLDAIAEEHPDQIGRAYGDPLWPERFDRVELDRKRREIGERAWQSQYQGRPRPQAGSTWKRWWFRYWYREGEPLPPVYVRDDSGALYQAECRPLPPVFDTGLQSWDMTFKKTTEGSFVVGQVWGRTGADCFLIDEFRARVNFPGAVTAVEVMSNRWPFALTKLVENKANGPAVVAVLQSKIPGLIEVDPKGGKEARANAVQPMIKSGNVYLPHPHLWHSTDAWVDEAAGFPYAKYDDRVDAASQGLVYFVTDMGERGYSYSYVQTDDEDDPGPNGYAYSYAD